MLGIELQYLRNCIIALCNARKALLKLTCEEAVERIRYGKSDSLKLDAVPEIMIHKTLCEEFDSHLTLITEEIGSSIQLTGSEEELVCFADPMDRSKILCDFLKTHRGRLLNLFEDQSIIEKWESSCGGEIEISGPYGSISGIRHRQILFSVTLNYITGTLYIASENLVGSIPFNSVFMDRHQDETVRTKSLLESVTPCRFDASEEDFAKNAMSFVAYCKGKEYENNLVASSLFGTKSLERIREENLSYDVVGGPARILYLQTSPRVGFILANGEKITEWISWLAFVRYSNSKLLAYELSFDSSWTRDGILMAPSNAYSVLGDETYLNAGRQEKKFSMDLQKLKYFRNPSKYRGTILVCPASNQKIITDMALGLGVHLRFH